MILGQKDGRNKFLCVLMQARALRVLAKVVAASWRLVLTDRELTLFWLTRCQQHTLSFYGSRAVQNGWAHKL